MQKWQFALVNRVTRIQQNNDRIPRVIFNSFFSLDQFSATKFNFASFLWWTLVTWTKENQKLEKHTSIDTRQITRWNIFKVVFLRFISLFYDIFAYDFLSTLLQKRKKKKFSASTSTAWQFNIRSIFDCFFFRFSPLDTNCLHIFRALLLSCIVDQNKKERAETAKKKKFLERKWRKINLISFVRQSMFVDWFLCVLFLKYFLVICTVEIDVFRLFLENSIRKCIEELFLFLRRTNRIVVNGKT